MRTIVLNILLISVLFFLSCEENFSPYGQFQQKYILTCVLRGDTTLQTATLSHSYMPDGADPLNYNEDPYIVGADIRVWYEDSVYIFKDTSTAKVDTSRYSSPFRYYYNKRFKLLNTRSIEIEVLLQNGRRLRAASVTPADIVFESNSSVIIPPVNSDLVQFFWEGQETGTYFSPKFEIKYLQNVNGNVETKSIEVPLKYEDKDGILSPVYPQSSSRTSVIYDMDVVIKTLEKISEGDPEKGNYTIFQTPILDLLAFDNPLSIYLSSTSQSINDLTVNANTSDFTNIDGGLGIFGSQTNKNYSTIKFQQNFIESFGYNFIFDNE